MRILVISQHYWPENFRITDICKGFTDKNIQVDVLCGMPNYPKGEWFDGYTSNGPKHEYHEGTQIFRCKEIRRKGNTNLRIFLNYVSYPFFATFSLFRLRKFKYDAVFCYNTSPVIMMFPAIVYSKIKKVPLTTYVLDLWPDNLYTTLEVNNKFLRSIAKNVSHWFYRRCDKLISLSQSMLGKVQKIAPRAKHAVICQHCEDLYFERPNCTELKKRFSGKFNILFAGNISPAQNVDLLLKCAIMLKNDYNHNIRFIIVGDGMSKAKLENDIIAANVQEYFVFEGQKPVQDMPLYYGMCDALFAAYSSDEALEIAVPAKLASYFAAGKPCVVAIKGEGANAVLKSGGGLVSEPSDEQALYKNILTLANMPKQQLENMGDSAKIYCENNFKRDLILDKLIEFIFN